MTKTDAQQAIEQTAPTTKAAQLREVMPQIEKKLAAGVQLGTIHQALTDAGFELTFQTLKTYLYRYRKHRAKSAGRQAEPVDSRTPRHRRYPGPRRLSRPQQMAGLPRRENRSQCRRLIV
ncbi:hypothetical protein [Pandoraea vervacti]|uniref:hypothetical protein n=1 Tax=Pandoraea vervacti TaxID=656178 RepID=UPI001F3038A0|nr:hypothetical protein [Pandoraea vervacti]